MNHTLKIAIVYDYLRSYGGGERLLESIHTLWPNAPIYVTTADFDGLGLHKKKFMQMDIRTSFLQLIPFCIKHPLSYRLLLPFIWKSIRIKNFDVVIVVSGSNMANLVHVDEKILYINYVLTPPRFLYGLQTESKPFLRFFDGFYALIIWYLQYFDKHAAKRVDVFLSISEVVSQRIKRIYGASSRVIYPPIMLRKSEGLEKKKETYLVVSRLVRYKNIHIIINAFNQNKKKLIIVGDGPLYRELKSLAAKNITFTGFVDDRTLQQYYESSRALIIATTDEDFGLTAPEALSHGTPVIAYKSGGIEETVIHKRNGILFSRLDPESINISIDTLSTLHITRAACMNSVKRISFKKFQVLFRRFVQNSYRQSKNTEKLY